MEPVHKSEYSKVIERDVVINKMNVHIRSIFSEKTSLDSAMWNIVAKKFQSQTKKTK
jgi:hypothetical protein